MCKPLSILLVDDDLDDLLLFQEALIELGIVVENHSAADGQQALEMLYSETSTEPDFMFVDLNMPRMNGIELLTAVRSDEKFDNIPIIIHSTSTRKDEIEKCLMLGANAYLPKTPYFKEFCTNLKKIFEKTTAK